jgi:hypothetical protein
MVTLDYIRDALLKKLHVSLDILLQTQKITQVPL